MNKKMEELKKRMLEISHLTSILKMVFWDQEVLMPKKAVDSRAAATGCLRTIIHNKFVSLDADGLLTNLKKQSDKNKLNAHDSVIVSDVWRDFEKERKLPENFVKERAETTSKAQHVWAEAREKNDFSLFLPWLEKIVKLKRKEAALMGFAKSPYNALLDNFEPGMTAEEAARVLNDLKDFLIPFLKKIKSSKVRMNYKLKGFPIEKQIAFNELIAKKMGFDFEAGRMDKSTHPFSSGFHPQDVRFTTRYKKDDLFYSIGSTIHEVGHALYEQGLPVEHFGTPLAESISLGIHESQSRMWENKIGKSKEFWKYFYPKLQKEFPVFKEISLDDFYKNINKVQSSFIRTEADEVTYNLHIVIRFEIEKEMIEGSLDLKNLPEIWNSKMKDYLGVTVPSDSLGVLQDVHWSAGLFGYFPTYTLGNLYAAQFYKTMSKEIPNLTKKIAQGNLTEIREWLKNKIHMHGKFYTSDSLVRNITGEPLNSSYFIEYLREKYEKIYNVT